MDNKKLDPNMDEKSGSATANDNSKGRYRLDDERRVKVLSPGMMVMKRFFRNKLAIVGLIILAAMFIFSFLGPLMIPYSQSQVFKHDEYTMKEYASALYNEELRYFIAPGQTISGATTTNAMLAIAGGETTFMNGDESYNILPLGENSYTIGGNAVVAIVSTMGGKFSISVPADSDFLIDEGLTNSCKAAVDAKQTTFTYGDVVYTLVRSGRTINLCTIDTIALASKLVFDAYNQDDTQIVDSFDFRIAVETALTKGETDFIANDIAYSLVAIEDGTTIYRASDMNTPFAETSNILISAMGSDVVLSYDMKAAIRNAIDDKVDKFTLPGENGEQVEYRITRTNKTYTIKTDTVTRLITIYEAPSKTHLMGTDSNGMDILARLMYGGRISLMVGFVVIFLEVFLGVVIGGVSGYFGGWIDTMLMRLVDLFNCIPFYPTVMIIGAAMDSMEVEPISRIFLLMAVLGILGWPGIARIVRGQILSLREQDFMVAAEAGGISVSRKIFKHLVPNVMPLLIVQATMGLGGIIITEATLSFLGLGVKYPLASWGSMINAANSVHVMTNYWFVWIPAGLLIVLTVLGFNFVGDGLRDAFDPKMKR
ncbi:MAG: ABC transporter permease [Clostridia bacterium]